MVHALVQIQTEDRGLVQEIAATMAEAQRRSGAWIACRPGCTPCCMGPFAITALDALRLQAGMEALSQQDAARADAVRQRAAAYVSAIAALYPGDPRTGALFDEDALPESMEESPCPALDPASGLCDLYEARPLTCRIFGPATINRQGEVGACELCYEGAKDEQIAACAVEIDPGARESALLEALARDGRTGMTIVAYALAPAGTVPAGTAPANTGQ